MYKPVVSSLLLTHCLSVVPGSTVSMIMGLVFGGLSAFGAVQTSHDPRNAWVSLGKWLNLTSTCLFFGICFNVCTFFDKVLV